MRSRGRGSCLEGRNVSVSFTASAWRQCEVRREVNSSLSGREAESVKEEVMRSVMISREEVD